MQITVIVMPPSTGNGFKARVGAPWNLASEASDADTAFQALTEQLLGKVPVHTEFSRVDVPKYDRLFDVVGHLDPNSPAWSDWASEVDEYRAEIAAHDELVEAEHGV